MRRSLAYLGVAAVMIFAAVSCSTTRLLSDGQYRLVKNEIEVKGDKDFKTSKISPYLRQKTSWSPMLYVYNWAGRDSSGMTRFLKRLGQAPVIFDKDLAMTSAENMTRQMEYLGYYHSYIQPEISIKGKTAKVKYIVYPGKRYRIRSIDFDLPQDSTFRAYFFKDTANISIKKGDWLSVSSLEAETVMATEYFRNHGYFDIDKNVYSFVADTLSHDGTAALTLKISASTLHIYKFGKVSISYPTTLKFRESVLKSINTVRPGKLYSENIINNSYTRLSSLSAFNGVRITLNRSEDKEGVVDCDIDLTPAKQRGVKFKLEGSSNSNGLIGISPEITYYNRNIFHGSETLNLSFLGDWQFKPGTDIRSTEYGVSGSINFPRFLLLPSKFFTQRVPNTQIKLSLNSQNRPEYDRELYSTSYTYLWSRGRMNYQFSPLGVSYVRLHHIDDEFLASLETNPFLKNAYRNHLDIGSSFTIYYTTDPSVLPTGAYRYARLQVDFSGNVLSLLNPLLSKNESGAALIAKTPYSQYVRGELSLGRTWELWGNVTFASRVLAGAGYAYGNSTVLPYEKHFYSGGANSLRGWQARAVGPGYAKMNKEFIIPSQTGDLKLEANAELRFGITGIINGAVFADVGNIWTLNKETDTTSETRFNSTNFPGSLAADWGVGIRFNFKVILLRLDMGLKLRDPSLDGKKWVGPDKWFHSGGNAIHLAVGYPF